MITANEVWDDDADATLKNEIQRRIDFLATDLTQTQAAHPDQAKDLPPLYLKALKACDSVQNSTIQEALTKARTAISDLPASEASSTAVENQRNGH